MRVVLGSQESVLFQETEAAKKPTIPAVWTYRIGRRLSRLARPQKKDCAQAGAYRARAWSGTCTISWGSTLVGLSWLGQVHPASLRV